MSRDHCRIDQMASVYLSLWFTNIKRPNIFIDQIILYCRVSILHYSLKVVSGERTNATKMIFVFLYSFLYIYDLQWTGYDAMPLYTNRNFSLPSFHIFIVILSNEIWTCFTLNGYRWYYMSGPFIRDSTGLAMVPICPYAVNLLLMVIHLINLGHTF